MRWSKREVHPPAGNEARLCVPCPSRFFHQSMNTALFFLRNEDLPGSQTEVSFACSSLHAYLLFKPSVQCKLQLPVFPFCLACLPVFCRLVSGGSPFDFYLLFRRPTI